MKLYKWLSSMLCLLVPLAFICADDHKTTLQAEGNDMPPQETMSNIESLPSIQLSDYRAPSHLVKTIHLTFNLEEDRTRVLCQMHIEQNKAPGALILNGEKLKLLAIKLDGRLLTSAEYELDDKTLTIKNTPHAFVLEIENEIYPQHNIALEGLYKSGSIFCTQNEPEGFRKITYFLDRPDVMAKYTTKIIADQTLYPILLSNGNLIGQGVLPGGKHWAEWEDPFAKPSYLFALVAGDLGCISDTFITMQGRKVALKIYCDKGNESKCHHAMQSLKKAMKWDEEVYGLAYDLDIYMIVAVDAFNMGAMENKGLNIFNTSCVLADVTTATDDNYGRIEGVIAHEYFHNWTGNRVTCRDWFQLTLKEGLTVFRDQEFSADMHSRAVQRIENVQALRASQFPEDAGPTAHAIKPKSYLQINNFYTPTVYNKGAEVIRMMETLIGKDAFRQGIAKYFELYDGQAVTTEDFMHAMELVSGRDFTQFKRWYSQAGTPQITVKTSYDEKRQQHTLTIKQTCAPTADGSSKEPFHFPLAIGLIGKEGQDLPLKMAGSLLARPIIEITQAEESFIFEDLKEKPTLSINRHFTAPIQVKIDYSLDDYIFLMAHDTDAFNRWEAGQKIATELMLDMVRKLSEGKEIALHAGYIEAFGAVLNDPQLDNALKACALSLPSEDILAQYMEPIDIDGIHLVREFVKQTLAKVYQKRFSEIYSSLNKIEEYEFNATAVGQRSLKNSCLSYLSCLATKEAIDLCSKQFKAARNMTDQLSSLALLANMECQPREESLQAFYQQWKDDTLVMNKWLSVQALSKLDGTFERVKLLMKDPVYDASIPNLVRALIGSFTHNAVHFHRHDGAGYAFLADRIIEIDRFNPQMAATLTRAFRKYAKLDALRKKVMKKELERIIAQEGLSTNVYEMISQMLAWEAK